MEVEPFPFLPLYPSRSPPALPQFHTLSAAPFLGTTRTPLGGARVQRPPRVVWAGTGSPRTSGRAGGRAGGAAGRAELGAGEGRSPGLGPRGRCRGANGPGPSQAGAESAAPWAAAEPWTTVVPSAAPSA